MLYPLSTNFTKWSNTVKQFVGKFPTNCLRVFDHFVGLALKGLNRLCFSQSYGCTAVKSFSILKRLTLKVIQFILTAVTYLIYVNFDCVKFRDVEFYASYMESFKFVLSVFPEEEIIVNIAFTTRPRYRSLISETCLQC